VSVPCVGHADRLHGWRQTNVLEPMTVDSGPWRRLAGDPQAASRTGERHDRLRLSALPEEPVSPKPSHQPDAGSTNSTLSGYGRWIERPSRLYTTRASLPGSPRAPLRGSVRASPPGSIRASPPGSSDDDHPAPHEHPTLDFGHRALQRVGMIVCLAAMTAQRTYSIYSADR
jgi:hypothetical protein